MKTNKEAAAILSTNATGARTRETLRSVVRLAVAYASVPAWCNGTLAKKGATVTAKAATRPADNKVWTGGLFRAHQASPGLIITDYA